MTGTLLHFHNSQCNFDFKFSLDFFLDFSITYLFLPTIFITYPLALQSCQILFVMKRSRKYLFSNTIRVIFLKLKIQCTTVRSPGTKKHHSFVHRSCVSFPLYWQFHHPFAHCTCAIELIPFLWRAIIVTTTNGLVIIKVYFIK